MSHKIVLSALVVLSFSFCASVSVAQCDHFYIRGERGEIYIDQIYGDKCLLQQFATQINGCHGVGSNVFQGIYHVPVETSYTVIMERGKMAVGEYESGCTFEGPELGFCDAGLYSQEFMTTTPRFHVLHILDCPSTTTCIDGSNPCFSGSYNMTIDDDVSTAAVISVGATGLTNFSFYPMNPYDSPLNIHVVVNPPQTLLNSSTTSPVRLKIYDVENEAHARWYFGSSLDIQEIWDGLLYYYDEPAPFPPTGQNGGYVRGSMGIKVYVYVKDLLVDRMNSTLESVFPTDPIECEVEDCPTCPG